MRILYEGQARKYDAEVLATFATIIDRSVYRASDAPVASEGPR
jgi:hypothetical protein